MRLLVLGSLVPQTARTVWALLAAGHEIDQLWIGENASGVWRRRDRRLRWLAPTWSIEAATRRCGFRVRRVGPLQYDPALVADGCRPNVDAMLASCFPYLVPPSMLAFYAGRACNLHPALLPRYRGPAPMSAMVFDESLDASGVTLHLMAAKADAGDIIAQEPVPWPADGYYRTWEADLADECGRLAVNSLPRFLAGGMTPTPQHRQGRCIRRLSPHQWTVDAHMDERRARWLLGSLGRVAPLSVPTPNGPKKVCRVLSAQAAATGRPPRVTLQRVECDVADARLSLLRWGRWQRSTDRLRELATLARRPLAA